MELISFIFGKLHVCFDSQKRLLLIVRRSENHKPRCENVFLLAQKNSALLLVSIESTGLVDISGILHFIVASTVKKMQGDKSVPPCRPPTQNASRVQRVKIATTINNRTRPRYVVCPSWSVQQFGIHNVDVVKHLFKHI